MSVVQNVKSFASAIAGLFVPSVFWQRDMKTELGTAVSVQAREGKAIGLRMMFPSSDSNLTAILTIDEAAAISKLLNEAISQCELKQDIKQ